MEYGFKHKDWSLLPCIVCRSTPSDKCHIKTRGSGGTEDWWNLFPACREHHSEQHQIGIVSFFNKYSRVSKYFTKNGWYIDSQGKLRH